MTADRFDVCVVGGGSTGAALTLLLARAGARVVLLERDDFGSGTSQESSNLIWGGIKYLEHGELGLVRRLCAARDRLFEACPTQVRPVPFVLAVPHEAARWRRSRAALTFGAWLYRRLAQRRPPPSRWLEPSALARAHPQIRWERMRGALRYEDGLLVDHDARFVFRFVAEAERLGAVVLNGAKVVALDRGAGRWRVAFAREGDDREVEAAAVVDTAGPWAEEVARLARARTRARHLFSKGVHLVLDRPPPPEGVLASLDENDRPVFLIPMGPRVVIGTTDTPVDAPTREVTAEDRSFLLSLARDRFALDPPPGEDDVVAVRCGVRPLVVTGRPKEGSDWLALSRRHVVDVDPERSFVAVFGGKLTECVGIAEEVASALAGLGVPLDPSRFGRHWMADPPRPVRRSVRERCERLGLAPADAGRLLARFGGEAGAVLDRIEAESGLAERVFPEDGVLRAEVEHHLEREHVRTLEDLLRRRTRAALLIREQDLRARPVVRNLAGRVARRSD